MRTRRVVAILLVLSAGLQTAGATQNARPPPAQHIVVAANHSSGGSPGVSTAFSRPLHSETNGLGNGDATRSGERVAQQGGQVIPPSMALRLALSYSPGSQGLDVTLVEGRRLMYAVKLKTETRVHRVLVDAHTGEILGE